MHDRDEKTEEIVSIFIQTARYLEEAYLEKWGEVVDLISQEFGIPREYFNSWEEAGHRYAKEYAAQKASEAWEEARQKFLSQTQAGDDPT